MHRLSGILITIGVLTLSTGCTQHRVTVDPIEVKPIHMTVDINVKVDRELEDFFDFEEELDAGASADADPNHSQGETL